MSWWHLNLITQMEKSGTPKSYLAFKSHIHLLRHFVLLEIKWFNGVQWNFGFIKEYVAWARPVKMRNVGSKVNLCLIFCGLYLWRIRMTDTKFQALGAWFGFRKMTKWEAAAGGRFCGNLIKDSVPPRIKAPLRAIVLTNNFLTWFLSILLCTKVGVCRLTT